MILKIDTQNKNIQFYLSGKDSMHSKGKKSWDFVGERNYV